MNEYALEGFNDELEKTAFLAAGAKMIGKAFFSGAKKLGTTGIDIGKKMVTKPVTNAAGKTTRKLSGGRAMGTLTAAGTVGFEAPAIMKQTSSYVQKRPFNNLRPSSNRI